MDILQKIRNQPEKTRKLILWTVVIFLGLVLFFFWIKNSQKKLESFKTEEFKKELNFPKLEMPEINIPEIKMPEISEEKIKELEEMIKEVEKEQSQ